ncbi:hypothetical protein N9901_03290 [Flavobacteriaceae bacterium]|nr:hypothetical protein [Flavobacteriaceae bacterium]
MEKFEKAIINWYNKIKIVLNDREEKEDEYIKCNFLLENTEYHPDFVINMVNVCGTYNVCGGNPDLEDSYYTGVLSIDLISNQIVATWLIEGEHKQLGYGFVFNNTLVLSFSYMDDDKNMYNGVVAYEFLSSDIIVGKWTEEVAAENAFEVGRKLSPEELGQPYPEDYFSVN